MRLWPVTFFEFMPDSQILAQKREVDLIWKDIAYRKKTNHILINYIWEYEDYEMQLLSYYNLLYVEFQKRGFKFNWSQLAPQVWDGKLSDNPFAKHHTNDYLKQCFYNLQEKYQRGQKDFKENDYLQLELFMRCKGLY